MHFNNSCVTSILISFSFLHIFPHKEHYSAILLGNVVIHNPHGLSVSRAPIGGMVETTSRHYCTGLLNIFQILSLNLLQIYLR